MNIEVGDHIAFQAKDIPLPHVEAAVITVHQDGVLEVMSTLLAPFQHGGRFKEEEVGELTVVRTADEAIPLESRGKFTKGASVSVRVGDDTHVGQVIAAFDGIVSAQQADGEYITGGTSFFNLQKEE